MVTLATVLPCNHWGYSPDLYGGESVVCTGSNVCHGDSGGPLVCKSTKDSETYIQYGATSYTTGCKADSSYVSGYASVAAAADWITTVTCKK